jgi:hypothetical protein
VHVGSSEPGLSTIAIMDHGKPGEFCLLNGNSVSLKSLSEKPELEGFFVKLGKMVAANGRIDLLACNLTAGLEGKNLLASLENLTKRNFAASSNLTGDGGDFILESDNVNVQNVYFLSDKIKAWKHSCAEGDEETVVEAEEEEVV